MASSARCLPGNLLSGSWIAASTRFSPHTTAGDTVDVTKTPVPRFLCALTGRVLKAQLSCGVLQCSPNPPPNPSRLCLRPGSGIQTLAPWCGHQKAAAAIRSCRTNCLKTSWCKTVYTISRCLWVRSLRGSAGALLGLPRGPWGGAGRGCPHLWAHLGKGPLSSSLRSCS